MYTEEEIRKAMQRALAWSGTNGMADKLIEELRNIHSPIADTDTITVRELREAYDAAMEIFDDNSILAYIREHRENYPLVKAGTVWMDRNNMIWQRTKNGRWTQFGTSSTWDASAPVRPLRQMKAQ